MATNTTINHKGVVYDVEHSENGHYERVVVWTTDELYVGDVFLNHSQEVAMTEVKDGRRIDSDYHEVGSMTIDEAARWIIDQA